MINWRTWFCWAPRCVWALPLALVLQSCATVQGVQAQPASAAAVDAVIYADILEPGWVDWSWDTTVNLAAAAPVHSGTASISARFDLAWAGLYFHADPARTTAGYTHLRFWLNGGALGGQRIRLVANENDAATVTVTARVNQWTQHDIPLADLGSPAALTDLYWMDDTGGGQDTFYLDDISLVNSGGGGGGSDFPEATADASRGGLDRPAGLVIAPSGRVYVAIHGDPDAAREGNISSWPSTTALMSGLAPDIVLGPFGNTYPEAVAVDSQNRLYVADTYNDRVLVYNIVTTSGQQPDFVFGSKGTSTVLENKFDFTRGLALDSRNHLLLTDEFNHRVLVYDLPITSNNPTPIAQYTGLNGPRAVAVDGSDDIYIADSENGVVKVFDGPAAAGGPYTAPSRTIGQPHNASECPSTGANTAATYLACPIDLALDAAGRLYVSDTPNHRILGFVFGASTPAAVYGQADFTSYLPNRGGAAGSNTLRSPLGMDFDSAGNFYVADFENDRVLRFDAPTQPGGDTVALAIDAGAQRRPISPNIYGMNFAPEGLADELDLPLNRFGGNSTTRYNYQTDISNHALDYYFENEKETDATDLPADSWANRFIEQNRRTGTQTLLTLPMTGWVSNGVEYACGYDVSKYGPQQEVEPFRNRCGNGVRTDGTRIANNDKLDTSIAAPPSFTAGWVNFLKARYGEAADGGVRFYNLDNEPDIWWETHRDVKPVGWKYQELLADTVAYASAVKTADPGALLLGPVVNGWTYYWYGAFDAQREDWSTPDDRLANGDMPFVPWYLQQLRQYEQQNDVRLLDYLDLHYYPQADGVALRPAGNAATQALRLRSTRGLWDPTYVDESWIADTGPDEGIVQLLPRMRAWVEQYYPGTKLAVSEYNWGALDHINGALAQAEVLGVFGREGLDLATLWSPPAADQPGAFAFRIYRNYDGQGGRFGDTSVQATSADAGKLSIFAAQRSTDGALTAVVINKTDGPLTGSLSVANASLSGAGEWRRYSAANLANITPPAAFALGNGQAELTFPPQSITLLVLPIEMGNERLYLPAVRRGS